MAKYIKMAWDCPSCGRKDIPGDVRSCPGCGTPVGDNIKYHLPSEKTYVDEKVVPKGPDWQCAYCGSYNHSDRTVCSNCGGSRDGTKNYFEMKQNNADNTNTQSYDRDYTPKTESSDSQFSATRTFADFFRQYKFFFISAAAAIALIAALIVLFVPRERTIVIKGMSWERIAYVDRYQTVQEDDWSLPRDGRLRYTHEEIHHYDHVLDGYKDETYTEQVFDHYEYDISYRDLGNGYAEEVRTPRAVYRTETKTRQVPVYKDVPVYRTKYYYDIDKYVSYRQIKTEGADKNPYWSENEPVENPKPQIGDERVSNRKETYMIAGYISGKSKELSEYNLSYGDWQRLNVNDTVRCKVNIVTKRVEILEIEE